MLQRIAVASLLILLATGLVVAQADFVPLNGIAYIVAPPQGGEVRCIGGSPVASWPPCTTGSIAQIRGRNLTYRQEFVKPDGSVETLHTGLRTVVLNAFFDEIGRGRVWGTWKVVLDAGLGEWEGTFTGSAAVWFGPATIQIIGHGTAGAVDRMQLRVTISYDTFPIDPSTGLPALETISGFRLEPGSTK